MILLMVFQVCMLTACGGRKVRDTVRKMMRKLGTNGLWSNYSLVGRKGKRSLKEQHIYRLLFSEELNVALLM